MSMKRKTLAECEQQIAVLEALIMEEKGKMEALLSKIEFHRTTLKLDRYGAPDYKLEQVLTSYHRKVVEAQTSAVSLRQDVVVWMRALAMLVETAGNSITHREKESRIRAVLELIESAANKLREPVAAEYWPWNRPDIFRSDYPVRYYQNKVRELQAELEAHSKKAELTPESEPPF